MRTCRLCPVYGRNPIRWNDPEVCDACRGIFRAHLDDVVDQFARLDPTPSLGRAEHVGGSRDLAAAARLVVLDHTAICGPGDPTLLPTPGTDPDQIGHTPGLRVLHGIARDWLTARRADNPLERGAPSRIDLLVRWLDHRLDWACEYLPASLPDHAAQLRTLVGQLHAINGDLDDEPELIIGVPCWHCDLRAVLVRQAGAELIECSNCGRTRNRDDYERWVNLNAAHEKQDRKTAA